MKFRCWQQCVFLTFNMRFGNEDSECRSVAAVGWHVPFFRGSKICSYCVGLTPSHLSQNTINMNGSSLYVFRGVQFCELCRKLVSQDVKLFLQSIFANPRQFFFKCKYLPVGVYKCRETMCPVRINFMSWYTIFFWYLSSVFWNSDVASRYFFLQCLYTLHFPCY
jgi:hypothetical protein